MFRQISGSISIKMKRRLPLSSLLSCRTAWPVVPEPAKESSTMSSFRVLARTNERINETGLG